MNLQDVAWAVYTALMRGDEEVQQAVGPACAQCWAIAVDTLMYESWDSFSAAYADSQVLQNLVRQIRHRMQNKGADPVQQFEVGQKIGTLLTIEKPCQALLGCQTKEQLGVQRLSKEALKGVPSVGYYGNHENEDIDSASRVFLFDDQQTPMTCKISQYIDVSSVFTSLPMTGPQAIGNLYEGHADAVFEKLLGAHTSGGGSGWKGLLQGNAPQKSIDTVMDDYQVWIANQRVKRAMPRGASSGDLMESPSKLSGPGAGMISLMEEDDASAPVDLHADLSSAQAAASAFAAMPLGSDAGDVEDDAETEDEQTSHSV